MIKIAVEAIMSTQMIYWGAIFVGSHSDTDYSVIPFWVGFLLAMIGCVWVTWKYAEASHD